MTKPRKLVVAFLVATLGVLTPAAATAQVPPEVEEILPELPPEVEEVLDEVLAQLPMPLVPAVDGVGQASASPGRAQASVVDIDGVVTLGKSETTSESSKVTVLSVGGTDLLVREGDADGGYYTGELAAAGDVVDQINDALCPGGPPTAQEQKTCVLVAYSSATHSQPNAVTNVHSARFRLLSIHTDQAPEGLTVGSTTADSIHVNLPPFAGGPNCTDIATSFLVSGTGTFAALILVNPGFPDSSLGLSIAQPC